MGERDALGSSGAAAGVEQLGNGVLVDFEDIGAVGAALVEQFVGGEVGAGDLLIEGDVALNGRAGGPDEGWGSLTPVSTGSCCSSASAKLSDTSRSTCDNGVPSAEQIEPSSSDDASFWPRSTSER